ncbi:MAG: carboxypeptidase regulatory-like domain-containing protein [Calditrichaeota bacterium]|nr:carboxypeptidase regulatory-like domain-containing protein [Calditrichota bacterium]
MTANSPCIDAGDPDSPEDPDGTRADMGSFPVYQFPIVIEGFVFNASNEAPLENAKVETSYGNSFFTDEDGFYHIPRIIDLDMSLTASMAYYSDSTQANFEFEDVDTLELNFGLLHSEFNPSEERFTPVLSSGDSTSINFSINNTGNDTLVWQAEKRLSGESGVGPWELRRSYDVSNTVNDPRVEGVVFANDRFYVSGVNSNGDEGPMIYVLDRDGHEINRFPQLRESHFGMKDLAWDGELIWGCTDYMVIGFNTEGNSVTAFEGPEGDLSAITWDPDHEVLWMARRTGRAIYAVKRDGSLIDSLRLPRFGLRLYGLAYWQDAPDNSKLYIYHSPDNETNMVYKVNPDNQDTTLV